MARKRKKDSGGSGSPAWMATFSDLMNLLLCFFVLLFAMSNVDAEKFQQVVASMQSSFGVLPSGGSSIIKEGQLVSSGISQLDQLDVIYNEMLKAEGSTVEESDSEKDYVEQYEQKALSESEKMAESIKKDAQEMGIQNQIEVDFNGQYVTITLNGALLFDSGSVEIKSGAVELVDKIGNILEKYDSNIIEIEGHTDNVPVSAGSQYKNNDVLSTFRALSVAEYLRSNKDIDPAKLKYSGRGEYVPVADNTTVEGRARNRRVEIKVYNSFNNY